MYIDKIFKNQLHLTALSHTPCVYHRNTDDSKVYILVDNFYHACINLHVYKKLCDILDKHLSIPITCHGLTTHFNGLDVKQTAMFISISVKKHLSQALLSHWQDILPTTLPMHANSNFVKALDDAELLDYSKHKH